MGKISVIYALWSVGTVILVLSPQKSECVDPITAFKTAASALGPFISNYMADLRAKREAEKIKIRIWMHNGNSKMNGCGFYFRASGYAGSSAEAWFPKNAEHRCGNDKYRMRMTSQSVMYDKTLHLGNEQVENIEVHADGFTNTYVNVMCIGMNERTIAGGPRAFCLNNDILLSCNQLYNKWNDVDIFWGHTLTFTRTKRAIHKIIFYDVAKLVDGFEELERNRNSTDAMKQICDHIHLVKGTHDFEEDECPAEKVWMTSSGMGAFYHWETHSKYELKNPHGCERYTHT